MTEEELLEELEDNIPYDYCRSEGTEDNTYQEWIDEDSWQFQLKLLVENKNKEIERLNNIINELRHWIVNNKHNENTKEHYLVVDYGELLNKLQELEGSDKE